MPQTVDAALQLAMVVAAPYEGKSASPAKDSAIVTKWRGIDALCVLSLLSDLLSYKAFIAECGVRVSYRMSDINPGNANRLRNEQE